MELMKKPKSMHDEDCDCSRCMADGGSVSEGDEGSAHFDTVTPSTGPAAQAPAPEKKSLLAKGGEVKDDEGDEELHDGVGKELMEAIHSKDHKKLMSGIEAMVLHHMSKKD